jgi:uncharacterized protein (DUF983 family)
MLWIMLRESPVFRWIHIIAYAVIVAIIMTAVPLWAALLIAVPLTMLASLIGVIILWAVLRANYLWVERKRG